MKDFQKLSNEKKNEPSVFSDKSSEQRYLETLLKEASSLWKTIYYNTFSFAILVSPSWITAVAMLCFFATNKQKLSYFAWVGVA